MNDDATLRAQMALDGELDAANQLAFERELERSPELATHYAELVALREAIRAQGAGETAPQALRARVAALAAPARRWPLRPAALAATLALAAALAGFGAGRWRGDPTLPTLVAFYQRAALSGQPVDVASSDRHTVKPWLAARAPFGALAPDLAEDGFPLLGGRIDILDRRPIPTLVYRRREHLISVSELPLAQSGAGAATLEGYHVERWRDGERAYVAISDIDAAELAGFVNAFARKIAP